MNGRILTCISFGDKHHLSDEDRRTYEQSWQLFVDRGDYEAHWSFYDEGGSASVVEAAKQTQLGTMVYPLIQRTIDGIGDFLNAPADRNWRDWIPVKELQGTLPIVQSGLKELGWRLD